MKVNRKQIIKELNKKELKRRNHTFRFETALLEKFKEECKKDGKTATAVLEKMIKSYIAQ